jgi:hypothetical protein
MNDKPPVVTFDTVTIKWVLREELIKLLTHVISDGCGGQIKNLLFSASMK